MVPIEKNILVVDEQGNEYEATWPKRARGLVKNGRARFLSENKICLACPPDRDLEDNGMTDIRINNIETAQTKNNEYGSGNTQAEKAVQPEKYIEQTGNQDIAARTDIIDLAYIFKQIREIQLQTTHLNEVIDKLSKMGDGDSGECGSPGNLQGQAKAQALGDVVRCRETTNQQLLNFYMKVYDDMTSQQ